MSRRSGDSSSWKTPTRAAALAARSPAFSSSRRLALGHEDQRLLARPAASRPPARRARRGAGPRRAASAARSRPTSSSRSRSGSERGRRGEGAEHQVGLALSRRRRCGAGWARTWSRARRGPASRPSRQVLELDRRPARAAAARRCRRGAWSWCRAAAARAAPGARAKVLLGGQLLRAQELEQAEEAVRVVLERRGGQQQRRGGPAAAIGATAR